MPSTTSWLSGEDDWGDNVNDNASEQNGNNMLMNDPLQFHFSLHKEIDQEIRDELSVLRVDDPNANRSDCDFLFFYEVKNLLYKEIDKYNQTNY